MKDTESDVRKLAVYALGKLGAKEAIPDLTLCLKDTDENVRKAAQEALKKLQKTHDSVQKSPLKVE